MISEKWNRITTDARLGNLTDIIGDVLTNNYYEKCVYYDKDEFHKVMYEVFGLTPNDLKHSVEIELFDNVLGDYVAIVTKRLRKEEDRVDVTLLADTNYKYAEDKINV